MKKIYHILILLILSLSGYSQVYQAMPQYGYGPVKRFWVDSTLSIPTVCGVPTLKANVTKQAAIAFDSCNNRFYFYNPKTLAWDTIKGGGGSTDTTSLSNRINGKVDSVKRSADSVYYYKNGVKYLGFRDSIGGVQNGRWGNDTATIVLAKVRNATATTMARGTVVMLSGATGDVASVIRANNKYDSTSARTIGLVKDAIAAGDTGWVVTQGQASKLQLGAYTAGDILWLDSIDGGLTKTKPYAPYHEVFVCIVERANNGNGLAYVKPQNGQELGEVHDVQIINPINNQILVYSDTQDIWKNRSAYSVIDTSKLSARIDQRVKYSDTASMLTNYAKKNYFNLQNVTTNGNITDSSIKALDYYFYDKAAEDFGQQKIDFSDNSFRFFDVDGNSVFESFNNNIQIGNGLRYGLISTDYITTNRRIDFPDTSGTFALRGDSTLLQTKYRSDTARTNTYNAINAKPTINGTGFVKASGTSINYDNSTYVTGDLFILGYQALGSSIKGNVLGAYAMDRLTTSQLLVDGGIRFCAVYVPVAATVTGVKFFQVQQGAYTADNYNGVALYSKDGDTLRQIALSKNTPNLWKASANSWVSQAFDSTCTCSLTAGIYYVGANYNVSGSTTNPTISCTAAVSNSGLMTFDFTNSGKITGTLTGQSSLPAKLASSTIVSSTNTIPFYLY